MAEEKNSFIAYCNWLETFEELTDEQAGKLAKHLFRYVNDLNPETDDILIKAVFVNIKQALKRDLKKWESQKENKSNSGIIGNLKRWHPDIYKKFKENKLTLEQSQKIAKDRTAINTIAEIAVSDSVNVSVSDSNKLYTSATEILELLNSIKQDKLDQMIELTKFSGDLKELKQKFSLEFVGRYGLHKTKKEVLETFQSWMSRDKTIRKEEIKTKSNSLEEAVKRTHKRFNKNE